ncbi:MAG: dephospho-CoA kinase [Alistipes sp.]|nr:dephospho-CoA kinase [Alistipes sp.]
MYKIGVTGGIGSGKSTVCELLRDRGVAVYDSDSRAKQLMAESDALREQLTATFGAECYNAEGLNRAFLASKVFGNEEALQQLNSIVHPAVRADFQAWAEQQQSPYVVLESAILFEAGFETEVDATLAVMAPMPMRLERTMARDGVDKESVMRRMEHQLSDDELHRRASRTIVNINREYLEGDIEQLHKIFVYESQRKQN